MAWETKPNDALKMRTNGIQVTAKTTTSPLLANLTPNMMLRIRIETNANVLQGIPRF